MVSKKLKIYEYNIIFGDMTEKLITFPLDSIQYANKSCY